MTGWQIIALARAGGAAVAEELKVFLTAGDYSGAQMGGLAGADVKCNQEAQAAGRHLRRVALQLHRVRG